MSQLLNIQKTTRYAVYDGKPSLTALLCQSLEALASYCQVFDDESDLIQNLEQRPGFDVIIVVGEEDDRIVKLIYWMLDSVKGAAKPLILECSSTSSQASNGEINNLLLRAYRPEKPSHTGKKPDSASLVMMKKAPIQKLSRDTAFSCEGYTFDTNEKTVSYRGESHRLKPMLFDLAVHLFFNIGRVLSREALYEAVWGEEVNVRSRTLDTNITQLRAKLKLIGVPLMLESIYGQGYILRNARDDQAFGQMFLSAAEKQA